ncbi:MAG: class I SAM-dependent methyltransferase [Methanoregulaceae archaeon]|nr:class I SAM-dependent methyltransferase [Methanoregulaceae archaeon]
MRGITYLRTVAQSTVRALKNPTGEYFPPGHFYSPIPSKENIERAISESAQPWPAGLSGIDFNIAEQVDMLHRFSDYYSESPFHEFMEETGKFFLANPAYSYADAIILYCMMRDKKPRRIIEVGSGYSTLAMMEVNNRFFNDSIQIQCIEPDLTVLRSIASSEQLSTITLHASALQDVDLHVFSELGENDFLFIDSTHVSKAGSDVNRIFFNILPNLKAGVLVHFHDISYPFEYPSSWLRKGRAWNENYILRAFLTFNPVFKIIFFTSYLEHFHHEFFMSHLPLALKDSGSSIWLHKIQ